MWGQANSASTLLSTITLGVALTAFAPAQSMAMSRSMMLEATTGEVITGIASFYDDPGETASGEMYDPDAFTAAALIEIRDKFGGIKFGRLYQASYAVAEYGGKRAILKFNDVGPLRPGRKFDLSRAAMAHFGGLDKGLLPEFKVTLLPPGQKYTPGPLADGELLPFDAEKQPIAGLRSLDSPLEIASLVVGGTSPAGNDDGGDTVTGSVGPLSASEIASLVPEDLATATIEAAAAATTSNAVIATGDALDPCVAFPCAL
jgi:rare lipoprotein A